MSEDKPKYGTEEGWVIPKKVYPKSSFDIKKFLQVTGYKTQNTVISGRDSVLGYIQPDGSVELVYPSISHINLESLPRVFSGIDTVLVLRDILNLNNVATKGKPGEGEIVQKLGELKNTFSDKVKSLVERLET